MISPAWLRIHTYMRRACRSRPPYALCCVVENRLRSPPLEVVEPLTQRQHTTTVCGGGGLNKYQGPGADALKRAAHAGRVCRACGHAWGCKSPVQVCGEPKDKRSARASPR